MTNKFSQELIKIFYENKKKVYLNIKNKNYTFNYLDKKSNQIANLILTKINQGDKILIAADKNIIIFSTIFACLKIGSPYSIIDFEMPIDRLKKIIKKFNPKLIISNRIDDLKKIKSKNKFLLSKKNIDKNNTSLKEIYIPDSLPAYIMFTSGSTGFPKGAIIERKSILNFIKTAKKKFKIINSDILTNVNPIYFDNSIFDIYVSFFNGIKLVIFQNDDVKEPKKLFKILIKNKCSSWFSTPSLLIYLLKLGFINKKNFNSINKIIFGGEGFPKPQLKEMINLLQNKYFYNVYGPTEGTCICSSHLIKKKDLYNLNGYVTIGKIWKDFKFMIGKTSQRKIFNTRGELILFGPNISKGYIGDKLQTKRAFISKKNIINLPGYKTGDIVKNLGTNKQLYFVGRKDTQVKVMGHRIELNEIELSLNQIVGVNEAIVFTSSYHNLNNKIIAFVSYKSRSLKKDYVYEILKKKLPNYMIPSNIFLVNNLLKNSNNKIDRVKIKKEYEKRTFI